jgi:uncharacterized protein YkwD
VLDLARRASARVSIRIAVVAVGAIAVFAACTPLNSQEVTLLSSTNDLRKANGLNQLAPYDPLTSKARSWAATLAAEGRLAHEDLHSLGVDWTEAAENVGRAGSIEEVIRLLQGSAEHRANMLNSAFVLTGVGTARAKDGTVYAVQLFIKS